MSPTMTSVRLLSPGRKEAAWCSRQRHILSCVSLEIRHCMNLSSLSCDAMRNGVPEHTAMTMSFLEALWKAPSSREQ